MQGPPCFWSPWIDSWRSYEGPTGVREVRGSPAARNRKAVQDTGGGPRARFRRGQGSGWRVEASGSFLAGRQSCCEPWPELGCTGAAGPRWSRGAARWSKMPVVLGIRGGCSAAVGHKEGLRDGLQGPIKEEAGGLDVRAPVGIAVGIRVGEADRATDLRTPGLWGSASRR
jgi:hypothetical protein